MREIKFRAWDGIHMIYNVPLTSRGEAIITNQDNMVVISDSAPAPIVDTVMQYTGLKDKNGVEIYEGDIINEDHKYGWKKHVMVLDYFTASDDMGVDVYGYPNVNGTCEIIGNIYENPELLEDL